MKKLGGLTVLWVKVLSPMSRVPGGIPIAIKRYWSLKLPATSFPGDCAWLVPFFTEISFSRLPLGNVFIEHLVTKLDVVKEKRHVSIIARVGHFLDATSPVLLTVVHHGHSCWKLGRH